MYECPVCNETVTTLDNLGDYYILTDESGDRPYRIVCKDHDLGEVLDNFINRLRLVDGRLYEDSIVSLGQFMDRP